MWNIQKSGLDKISDVCVCICVFCISVYMCVYVTKAEKIDHLLFENGLSYRTEIWYARGADTTLSSRWIWLQSVLSLIFYNFFSFKKCKST